MSSGWSKTGDPGGSSKEAALGTFQKRDQNWKGSFPWGTQELSVYLSPRFRNEITAHLTEKK